MRAVAQFPVQKTSALVLALSEGAPSVTVEGVTFAWRALAFSADSARFLTYLCLTCGGEWKDEPSHLASRLTEHARLCATFPLGIDTDGDPEEVRGA